LRACGAGWILESFGRFTNTCAAFRTSDIRSGMSAKFVASIVRRTWFTFFLMQKHSLNGLVLPLLTLFARGVDNRAPIGDIVVITRVTVITSPFISPCV
jgi:hypothetical protein